MSEIYELLDKSWICRKCGMIYMNYEVHKKHCYGKKRYWGIESDGS